MNVLTHAGGEGHAMRCDLAAEILRSSGTLRLQAMGWSMMPAVRPGDLLTIEAAKSASFSEGDIVLFGRDRRLYAHRVKKIRNCRVMTQGDAMPAADPAMGVDELLGRVSLIERSGKPITPPRNPSFSDRIIAALVRNSQVAAHVVIAIHCRHQSRKSSLQNRDLPCQS